MKGRAVVCCIFTLNIALASCAFPRTYFKPEPIAKVDNSQLRTLFIYRGDEKLTISNQENSDSTWVEILFVSLSESYVVPSKGFTITSGNNEYLPTRNPWRYGHDAELDFDMVKIKNGDRLIIQFSQEIQKLNAFVLHLPPFTNSSGRQLNNIRSIKYFRRSGWAPLPWK